MDGGANRFIKTSSQDDVNIAAELEQATTFKNIILYLPPTNGGSDMRAALELTDVAVDKLKLLFYFAVEKHSGGRMIESFTLFANSATITQRPYIVGTGQMLKVELHFSEANWYRGKLNTQHQMKLEKM